MTIITTVAIAIREKKKMMTALIITRSINPNIPHTQTKTHSEPLRSVEARAGTPNAAAASLATKHFESPMSLGEFICLGLFFPLGLRV